MRNRLKSDRNHYGDNMCLRTFATNPRSYQRLLDAIHETVRLRGTPLPILPDDVFGRHVLLGGVVAFREATDQERASLEVIMKKSYLEDDPLDPEEDLLLDDAGTSSERQDFFEIFLAGGNDKDVHDRMNMRMLKDFFAYATRRGDLIAVKPPPPSEYIGPMYAVKGDDFAESSTGNHLFEPYRKWRKKPRTAQSA